MQSNMMHRKMRNTISIAIAFGLLLIVAPTQAADKHVKNQQGRVVEYKAPAAWRDTDRSWWDTDRYAGNTRRNCYWVGPGGRATWTCR
jgi:hypothetical protein